MNVFKKINSIQISLLLHEMSYVLLILVTASVGIVWAYAWQNSSEESLRLTEMNSNVQNIRSELYRQLKEVFDAVFLHDVEAADEYAHYSNNIQQYLKALKQLHSDIDEQEATKRIAMAYAKFQNETRRMLTPVSPTQEQKYLLDKELERFTFTELETAFIGFEHLLADKQKALSQHRQQWVTRITFLAPIPVLLAISLLFFSRRFVRSNVLKPLATVMRGAKLISKGDFQHTIPNMGVDELARLAQAINTMAVELSASRDKLVEAKKQAALGELVPLVAHNIRNPLAGIRAISQVTLDGSLADDTRDALKDIIMAVDRLERWVTSLLTYLHPLRPHFVTTNLVDVTDEVLSMMSLQLEEKQIAIERTGWMDEACNVQLDCNLMEQTLFNLLQNAIEASPKKGTIQLSYRELDNAIELTIADEGVGMKFDPVAEEVIDGETKRLSCGLGIPFALKVIKQHEGGLEYHPRQPKGMEVKVTIPVSQTLGS